MATYDTRIHTRGGGWQDDQPLAIRITNRGEAIADGSVPPTGTTVTWSNPRSGSGSVTFFDEGSRFEGTAQFPGEGPVGYRGTLVCAPKLSKICLSPLVASSGITR